MVQEAFFSFLSYRVSPIVVTACLKFRPLREIHDTNTSQWLRTFVKYLISTKNSIFFITLAISKCYGKVRVLFFRATTLVSARKSHSSGVRGLVVRCLLFNPEVSCSNP